nr:hypothetical protein [Mycoplasmopsis bovis]
MSSIISISSMPLIACIMWKQESNRWNHN